MPKSPTYPFIVKYFYVIDKKEYTKWFETQAAAESFVRGTKNSVLLTTIWTSFEPSWEKEG